MSNSIDTSAPVTVIIPTYNGKHLLEKHLPEVIAAMRDKDELLIVDDASTDDTSHWLKDSFQLKLTEVEPDIDDLPADYKPPINEMSMQVLFGKYLDDSKKIRITVIKNRDNQRFAASVNLGFALASNRLVLLLNNDVSPEADVIEKLLAHFDDEEVFGVGCLEFERNADGDKAGKNKLWFSKGLFWHSKADNFISGETAWVSGGSGMFDREKWLDLNGLDIKYYPAYWEDVDISFRARKWGWKILFAEDAIVYHQHESTNDQVFGQDKIDDISWKHANYFSWKNGSLIQKALHFIWKPYWLWKRY